MDTFIESLPSVSGGTLRIINGESEGNLITKSQVTAAKAKGWSPLYYNSDSDMWKEYTNKDFFLRGDANGDGKINLSDVMFIVNCIIGSPDESFDIDNADADADQDGEINISDAVFVSSYILKGYFPREKYYTYFGTTMPNVENYKSLSNVATSYSSIEGTLRKTVSVSAGETLYMLCPVSWMKQKNITLENEKGDITKFSNEIDFVTIPEYAIYKLQVLDAPQKIKLKMQSPVTIIDILKKYDYKNLRMMGEMLNDKQETAGESSTLGADMYYYLISEFSKFAVFCPTDNDYFFYIDPASIIRKFDGSIKKMYALKFTYEPNSTKTFKTYVQRYEYNPTTHALTIDPTVGKVSIGEGGKPSYYATQIQDMLNYHTVVLDGTPGLVGSHYYLTKHGATVYVGDETASQIGSSTVQGPLQIGIGAYPASKVIEIFDENNVDARITNGTVYRLDSPIQPAIYNTHDILSDAAKYPKFQDFFDLVSGFSSSNPATDDYLTWCGILNSTDSEAEKRMKRARYVILDDNNRMAVLGTYNYTIYVPENMTAAFYNGLGNWDKVKDIYEDWSAHKAEYGYKTLDEAKEFVKKMINGMRSFVLYHIQNNSVYKDDIINTSSNETLYTNELGIAKKVSLIPVGSDVYIKDAVEGHSTTEYPKMTNNSNILVRDISVSDEKIGYDEFYSPFTYKEIRSSSFVVIHGIDKPLCYNSNGKY